MMYSFGERIKNVCEEKGISQQKLAENMGVTYAAVNQWINGKRIPKGKTAFKIAKAMGVNVTSLTDPFPYGRELENIFDGIADKIEKHREQMEKGDLIPEECGGVSQGDEIEALYKWENFLEETFYNIITFAISDPYPDGDIYEDEEEEEEDEDEGDEDAYSARGEAAVDGELGRILKEMLSSMKDSGTPDMQYRLVENLSKHILPAAYKTMAYAVRAENESRDESMETIALLYKQLNAKGQEVAVERLKELIQLPSYTASSETI